jgi:hypothetical protein
MGRDTHHSTISDTNPEAGTYTKSSGPFTPSNNNATRLIGGVMKRFTVLGSNQNSKRGLTASTTYPDANPAMIIVINMSIRTVYDENP